MELNRKLVSLTFFGAVLLIVALFVFTDTKKVIDTISKLSLPSVLLTLLLVTFLIFLRAYRWKLLLSASGISLSMRDIFAPYSAGLAVSVITPGKVGDVFRCFLIDRSRIKLASSLGSVMTERLQDLILLLLLSGYGVFSLRRLDVVPIIATAFIIFFLITIFASRRFARFVFRLSLPVISRVVGGASHTDPARTFYYTVRKSATRPEFYLSILLTAFIWGLEFFRISMISKFLGMQIPFSSVVSVYPAAIVVGVVTMIPGGLGSTDLSVFALLTLLGYPAYFLSALIVVDRFVSYWYVIFFGLASFYWLKMVRTAKVTGP